MLVSKGHKVVTKTSVEVLPDVAFFSTARNESARYVARELLDGNVEYIKKEEAAGVLGLIDAAREYAGDSWGLSSPISTSTSTA